MRAALQVSGHDAMKRTGKSRRRSNSFDKRNTLVQMRKNTEKICSPRGLKPEPLREKIARAVLNGEKHFHEKLVDLSRILVESNLFKQTILCAIGVASALVGVQTYDTLEQDRIVKMIEYSVLGIFAFEVVVKILAEGNKPWLYFIGTEWKWNNFDFAIVILCMPQWGSIFEGSSFALLRLVRLLRVMKIVNKIPQLQVIVEGLIGALQSVGYILLLLSMMFYLYAVAGVNLFRRNDPFHYSDIPTAMVSLFRMATMEDWTDIMYINIFGCLNHELFDSGLYVADTYNNGTIPKGVLRCQNQSHPITASLFHISFVVLSGLVMLSLFVGAVTMNMTHSLAEVKKTSEEKKAERGLRLLRDKLTKAEDAYNLAYQRWKTRQREQWKKAYFKTTMAIAMNGKREGLMARLSRSASFVNRLHDLRRRGSNRSVFGSTGTIIKNLNRPMPRSTRRSKSSSVFPTTTTGIVSPKGGTSIASPRDLVGSKSSLERRHVLAENLVTSVSTHGAKQDDEISHGSIKDVKTQAENSREPRKLQLENATEPTASYSDYNAEGGHIDDIAPLPTPTPTVAFKAQIPAEVPHESSKKPADNLLSRRKIVLTSINTSDGKISHKVAQIRKRKWWCTTASGVMGKLSTYLRGTYHDWIIFVSQYREFVHEKLMREDKEAYCKMRRVLLQAWYMLEANCVEEDQQAQHDLTKDLFIIEPHIDVWWLQKYDNISQKIFRKIVDHTLFERFIFFVIISAGILVGIQANGQVATSTTVILEIIDQVILAIFTMEIVLKILAEGLLPWLYFYSGWNLFDFLIVAASFTATAVTSATSSGNSNDAASILPTLRLVRLLRVLKVIKSLPELQVVVGGLIGGLASIGYIGCILVLFYYVFAIVGMILFRDNDPWHFGSLERAMLSLFRISTLEDWTDVMYINMYGCDRYGYGGIEKMCTQPTARYYLAAVYFVVFVTLGSLVLLTLFIGVVINSMEEAANQLKAQNDLDFQIRNTQRKYKLTDEKLHEYMEAFYLVDRNQSGYWSIDEVEVALASCGVKNATKGKVANWMIELDEDADGELSFDEIVEYSLLWKQQQESDYRGKNLMDFL